MSVLNPVPYALNQVMLYGAVVCVREQLTSATVEVCMHVQTREGEAGFAVHLFNRRALEILAFHQAHLQMYPDEPLLVSLIGRLAHREDETIVVGEAVTFHVSPDVRTWGGRLTNALLSRYVVQNGRPDWLAALAEEDDEISEPAAKGKTSNVSRPRR